jgi:arginine kinase
LTKALIKLYEQQNKSDIDPVKFIRKNMCESCPDDEQFEVLTADLNKANAKICQLEREMMRIKGSIRRTASEVDLALSKGFDELNSDAEKKSLLKTLLTKDILDQLKEKKTIFKGTLLDCVQSGLEIQDTPIGVFACDAEAYTVFGPLFEPLIENIHDFKKDSKHPALDWGDVCKIPELDESVISIKIQCIRSIDCFPFAANMNMDHYEEIMRKIMTVTKCMSGDFKGKFYPLEGMDKDVKKMLIDGGIVFLENNQLLKSANATRFWPTGRGVFVNEAKTFVVWCNEEDHLRFVSMEKGGNLSKNTS